MTAYNMTEFFAFENSRLKAWKALTIGFIIGIVIVNVLLIFKIVLKKKFFFEPKKLTIISLAIADIFCAMFSLVVEAIVVHTFDYSLDYEYKVSCTTLWVSRMYRMHLVNFVYGVGLVVLGLDLTLRLFNKSLHQLVGLTGNRRVLLSIAVGGVPWFVGLLLIIPLNKAFPRDGSHSCFTYDSSKDVKIMYSVSSCLPASAALLTGILIMFIRQKRHASLSFSQPSSETPTENAIIMNSQDPSTLQMQTLAIDQNFNGNDQPSDHQSLNSTLTHVNYQFNSPPETPLLTTNLFQGQPLASPQSDLTNHQREQLTLLCVCIVNFICVLPWIAYIYLHDYDELWDNLEWKTFTIITDIMIFLMISRSVLTPLIWIFHKGVWKFYKSVAPCLCQER